MGSDLPADGPVPAEPSAPHAGNDGTAPPSAPPMPFAVMPSGTAPNNARVAGLASVQGPLRTRVPHMRRRFGQMRARAWQRVRDLAATSSALVPSAGRPAIRIKLSLLAHQTGLLWLLVCVGVLELGIGVALVLVGGIRVVVPVQQGTPWWVDFPWQPAATGFVGIVALLTLVVTRRQMQLQFERKALDDEFTDILNRFADKDSVLMRANAANRLAQMAERPLPGKSRYRVPANYPYFMRAASQLAAALYMEEERSVRDVVVRAAEHMADFAKEGDQALLHLHVNELVYANRRAKEAFATALGAYSASVGGLTEDDLKQLAHAAAFCGDNITATVAALRQLTGTSWFKDAADVSARLRLRRGKRPQADEATTVASNREPFEALHLRAFQLRATRTALAIALRALATPLDVPDEGTAGAGRARHHGLADCFLAGAELGSAQLQEADLGEAQLQGADLWGAQLQRAHLGEAQLQEAHLGGAQLQGARLGGAQLQGARLGGAQLREANLWGAKLQGADLRGAKLQDALLWGAQLQGADLEGAQLQGANLQGANLQGANLQRAALGGAQLGGAELQGADLAGADWWDADFSYQWSDQEGDSRLTEWLQTAFPPPRTGPESGQ